MLQRLRLRFVLATGVSAAEVTLGLTMQLLKGQNEYGQVSLGLLDRLERILVFADIVADKIVADKLVCEETDLLEEVIPRMYEVMHKVAKVSCDSVKHRTSSHAGLG